MHLTSVENITVIGDSVLYEKKVFKTDPLDAVDLILVVMILFALGFNSFAVLKCIVKFLTPASRPDPITYTMAAETLDQKLKIFENLFHHVSSCKRGADCPREDCIDFKLEILHQLYLDDDTDYEDQSDSSIDSISISSFSSSDSESSSDSSSNSDSDGSGDTDRSNDSDGSSDGDSSDDREQNSDSGDSSDSDGSGDSDRSSDKDDNNDCSRVGSSYNEFRSSKRCCSCKNRRLKNFDNKDSNHKNGQSDSQSGQSDTLVNQCDQNDQNNTLKNHRGTCNPQSNNPANMSDSNENSGNRIHDGDKDKNETDSRIPQSVEDEPVDEIDNKKRKTYSDVFGVWAKMNDANFADLINVLYNSKDWTKQSESKIKKILSNALGLDKESVEKWFKNRKNRKRQKSSSTCHNSQIPNQSSSIDAKDNDNDQDDSNIFSESNPGINAIFEFLYENKNWKNPTDHMLKVLKVITGRKLRILRTIFNKLAVSESTGDVIF